MVIYTQSELFSVLLFLIYGIFVNYFSDEERNYYEVPQTVTETTFDEYVTKYGGTSFKRESTSTKLPTTYYKVVNFHNKSCKSINA